VCYERVGGCSCSEQSGALATVTAVLGAIDGTLLLHAYISSQLRGSLVAASLAEQKITEHDDGVLRSVQATGVAGTDQGALLYEHAAKVR